MIENMSLQTEALPIVRSSLALKHNALEFNLRRYRERLTSFEQQHQMTSEQFVDRFKASELGDDPDWFEWEFVLEAAKETERQLQLLESVKL
jgi:hypothetical protein